ncbi:MAG: protein kinase [Polyangiaceae bacterium]
MAVTSTISTSDHGTTTTDNSRSSGKSVFVRDHQRVGKYQILAELGRGGAASVCLAVTRGKGDVRKLVVLKALLPELAEEPSAVSAFLDEARLAAQLNHPNVVQTYEVGTESDRHVIVMEYLEGQSLSRVTRIARKSATALPISYHLRIIAEMLQGLHYAHDVKSYDGRPLKIVHRDVSPQNVIVTYDGQVKILDFGIAKAASSSTHTAAGIMKGKIAYMAPEQMAGTFVDRRADIYSAGCMLWAAATGQKLWQDATDVQIVRAVVAGRIPSPKTVAPECPDELERIVMRALQPDPEKRYSTALEMQNDLESFSERSGFAVKQRDLGKLVSELFAETRAEFNEGLERELSALMSCDNLVAGRDTLVDQNIAISEYPPLRETSASRETAAVVSGVHQASDTPPKRSFWLGAVALLLVGAAGAAFWFSRQSMKEQPQTNAASTSPTPAVTGAATNAATIKTDATVQFATTPADAHITLDGRLLEAGATSAVIAIGDASHEVAVEAEGFNRHVQSFKVNGPMTISVALTPKPEKRGVGRRSHGSVATNPTNPAATGTPAAKTPSESCENPFFVDAQGIKRVRPGCL